MSYVSLSRRARRTALTALCAVTFAVGGAAVAAPAHADDAPPAPVAAGPPTAWQAFAAATVVDRYVTAQRDATPPPVSAENVADQTAVVVRGVANLGDEVAGLPSGSVDQLVDDADSLGAYFEQTIASDRLDEALYELLHSGTVDPGTVWGAVGTVGEEVEAAERLVDAFRVIAYPPDVHLDSVTRAAATAASLVAYVGGTVDGTSVDTVLAQVSAIAQTVVDQPAARDALTQADTVMLYLGSQEQPLADVVPPTSDAAHAAAESLAASMDELARTAAGYDPDPQVGVTDAGVEAGPGMTTPGQDPGALLLDPVSSGPSDLVSGTVGGATGQDKCDSPQNVKCNPPLKNASHNAVQHDPTLQLIFWGPAWNDTSTSLPGDRAAVIAWANALSGSEFQAVLNQYGDAVGPVGMNVEVRVWTDPSAPPAIGDNQTLMDEAVTAHDRFGWRSGPNAQYLIFPEPGAVLSDGSCGHHFHGTRGTKDYIYGVVDHPSKSAGCRPGVSERGALTIIASHEYAEAATDPFVLTDRTAWTDGYYEIADICQFHPPGSLGGQLVTQLWSNEVNDCALEYVGGPGYVVESVDGTGVTPLVRGHTYNGAQAAKVTVRNTGSTTWYTGGAHPLRLITRSGACSHFYDPAKANPYRPEFEADRASTWTSCSRIKATSAGTVAPGESLTFTVPLRPDGFLDEQKVATETFDLVIETVARIPLRSGSYPEVFGSIGHHDATVDPATHALPGVAGLPDNTVLLTGVAGGDVMTNLTFDVGGDAAWYGNEVVDLATLPLEEPSRWAHPTWPSKAKTGACARCRAARVDVGAYPPTAAYTFPVSLHIPDGTFPGSYPVDLAPVTDVPVVGGGIRTIPMNQAAVHIILVVVGPKPLTHEVSGTGLDGPMYGPGVSDSTADAEAGSLTRWWACVALAGADALGITITSCRATIVHTDQTTGGSAVVTSGKERPGALATAVGTGLRLERPGDRLRVCWTATARYPAPALPVTGSGCSGA